MKKILAVIPARGGSKGLPGKNIREFAGHPLIAHTIMMARRTPLIEDVVVSTDDPKIAEVARRYDADVPFLRPSGLASDTAAIWPVIRHALRFQNEERNEDYKYTLLLDPTSPGRLPEDIQKAFEKLEAAPQADGVIGVSEPDFNPIWHAVISEEGWMRRLIPDGKQYRRRQDVPTVYRINASLYLWRSDFVRGNDHDWQEKGDYLMQEIPEKRAIHIDELYEFEKAELMVKQGLIQFPWLESTT